MSDDTALGLLCFSLLMVFTFWASIQNRVKGENNEY